jgi:hypothetical protein
MGSIKVFQLTITLAFFLLRTLHALVAWIQCLSDASKVPPYLFVGVEQCKYYV